MHVPKSVHADMIQKGGIFGDEQYVPSEAMCRLQPVCVHVYDKRSSRSASHSDIVPCMTSSHRNCSQICK